MFKSRQLCFRQLVLFLLAISFCFLLNSFLPVSVARSQITQDFVQVNNESPAKTLIDKAQEYNDRGQFRFSIPILEQAISLAKKSQDKETITIAQGVLGNAYTLAGEYNRALGAYQTSLKLAQEIGNDRYITIALNSQVNLLQTRQGRYLAQALAASQEKDRQEQARLSALAEQDKNNALVAANRAIEVGKSVGGIPQVRALLNIMKLSLSQEDLTARYRESATVILDKLPTTRSKAYSLIQLAQYQTGEAKIDSLEKASAISANFGDLRTQSFALGALGRYYEQAGQVEIAMKLTRQAQDAAEQVRATDSLYLWQWQAGRIYTADGAPDEAILSYKQAISSLQSIRGDIATANTDLQFDVRDSVEPVYRELMALLLDKGQAQEALSVSKLLTLVQLQSFFGDECLEVRNALNATQQVGKEEAAINSIILGDLTYMILRSPDGTLKSYPVALTAQQLQMNLSH